MRAASTMPGHHSQQNRSMDDDVRECMLARRHIPCDTLTGLGVYAGRCPCQVQHKTQGL